MSLRTTRCESISIRRHAVSVCGAARGWAWGVTQSADHGCSVLYGTIATPAYSQETYCSVQIGHEQPGTADAESDSELEDDSTVVENCFIPLGVEARAPSPPNPEAVKAQSKALWLLSQRTYTRHRLEKKLHSYQKFPDDAVAWAMQRVEASGYIDDMAWSRDYAQQKWRYSRWAVGRIGRELRHRGIDADTVESTLEWLQTEGQQGHHIDGTVTPPAADAEEAAENMHVVLVADARKKLSRLEEYPIATQRRRISSWLARLGHDWGVAQQIMREIELI